MFKTISFGEVLWDSFPQYKKPGGSPANVAYHLHCLGNISFLVSRVGKDKPGSELLSILESTGLPLHFVQTDEIHPTGEVTVSLSGNEPSYNIHQPAAWDAIEMTDHLRSELGSINAVCFASLSQREKKSAHTLRSILDAVPDSCLKVFDLNLRDPFFHQETILENIGEADVIKLNEDEFVSVSDWLGTNTLAEDLLNTDPSKTILLTRGGDGSSMFTSSGQYHQKAHAISGDGDFVGIGDAFLACFTHLKMLHTRPEKILDVANKYAAFVASQKGGMPDIPGYLLKEISGKH